jgi:hypothetical protein
MSKHSAILFVVAAAAVLAVGTGPRPVPGRGAPDLPTEHVQSIGTALVTEDLIAGRVTLAEAAARFRELERLAGPPDTRLGGLAHVRSGPWSHTPAETDADRLYLRVLVHVEAGVEYDPPDLAGEVFARLAREYLGLRAGGRPLVVPNLPPDRRDAVLTWVRQAAERVAAGRVSAR